MRCFFKLKASNVSISTCASGSSLLSMCMLKSPRIMMFLCLAFTSVSRSVSSSRNIVLVIPSCVCCGGWYIPIIVQKVDPDCTVHVRCSQLLYWLWFVLCVMSLTVGQSVVISVIPTYF